MPIGRPPSTRLRVQKFFARRTRPVTAPFVAEAVGISPSHASHVLRRLAKDGFLELVDSSTKPYSYRKVVG